MIGQDAILTGVWSHLNDNTDLRSILGDTGRIIKGVKRPDALSNPSITVQMPVRVHDSGWFDGNRMRNTSTEPILVTVFVDNYDNGAMDVDKLATICANIHSIAATSKPTITGARVHRLGQLSEAGPAFDQRDPHEAYRTMSFGYWLSDGA